MCQETGLTWRLFGIRQTGQASDKRENGSLKWADGHGAARSCSLHHHHLLLFLTIFSRANVELPNKVSSLQAAEDLHYLPVKHSCHQDRLPLCCIKNWKPLRWICKSAFVSQEMPSWLFGILSYCIDFSCIYTCVSLQCFQNPILKKKKIL